VSDIAAFIEARLSEAEATANAAAAANRFTSGAATFDVWNWVARDALAVGSATVLRLVAATRRIVGLHRPMKAEDALPLVFPVTAVCDVCVDWNRAARDGAPPEPWPCATLRAVASQWSDHPDYQPEWEQL
jgi:hypothetical protein